MDSRPPRPPDPPPLSASSVRQLVEWLDAEASFHLRLLEEARDHGPVEPQRARDAEAHVAFLTDVGVLFRETYEDILSA